MFQRISMIIVILGIVLGGGYYAYQELVPPPEQEASAPVYSTHPVTRGDIAVGVDAMGPLNPSHGGGIRIPGTRDFSSSAVSNYIIDKILIEEGNQVKQGEVIIKLAAPNMKAKIESAEEDLQSERRSLANLMNVPIEKVDQINPDMGITLRAPIEGRIVELGVKEGEEVKQGEIVSRVVDDSRFEVIAKLTPAEYEQISQDQVVVLRFPQYFSQLVTAKIKDINPNPVPESSADLSSDQAPGTKEDNYEFVYWVTLEGENPGLIRPDMPVTIGFLKDTAEEDVDLENIDPASIRWIRYSSKVDKFVNEEKVLSSAEAIITEVYVHQMEYVKIDDPIIALAGQDVKDTIQEKIDRIRDKKSELQQLRAQKDLLEIKAPMDGVVANIHREAGESVNPGDWIGSIYKTSNMMMWVQVDDMDILLVKQGSPVQVNVDALPGKTFEGTVERVSTMGKGENGISTFEATINVKGGPELRPGMQAKAFINAGSAKDVLLVPLEGIFQEDGKNKVEILGEDGIPKVVPVELGLMNDRVAEVKSGLEEGQLVITGSTADLLPSQKIQSDTLIPGKSGNGNNNSGDGGQASPNSN